jgi:hypothetical protein
MSLPKIVITSLVRQGCSIVARLGLLALAVTMSIGCAAIPSVTEKPTFHNPFPQISRVAVLPFFNQSREPTVDGEAIAEVYASELQKIPGYEVLPVGVVREALNTLPEEPRNGRDFQKFAQFLGVDAVLIGSVTEYHPYYPPRMGMAVHWYAANPSFHPIPAGYGLPWGTPEEEYIPESLVQEAEFALAKEQLRTQTPDMVDDGVAPAGHKVNPKARTIEGGQRHRVEKVAVRRHSKQNSNESDANGSYADDAGNAVDGVNAEPLPISDGLPADWPDPRGFVPAAPSCERTPPYPQSAPIIQHVRLYDGRDADFAERLARYFRWQDDARFGGWQGYLQRPDDFIRFCCHLHVTETLTARGGAGKSQVVSRWDIGR